MIELQATRLGNDLRRMRLARGLTQAQLAELAGMSREKVVRMEQGRDSIALRAYLILAHALGAELMLQPARRPTLDEVRELLGDG